MLLGVDLSTRNMGVGALAHGALKSALAARSDAEVSILDYGREPRVDEAAVGNKTVRVKFVNLRFSKKLFLPNNVAFLIIKSALIRAIPSKAIGRRLIANDPWLSEIDRSDVVASIAGGDSFADIYGLERFFYVALPQILALSLGKKLVMLPQTIGPFKSGLASFVAKRIMKRAQLVYSRDHAGVEVAKRLVGKRLSKNVRFCHDMGLILDASPPTGVSIEGPKSPSGAEYRLKVGLNVSGLLYVGGYTRNNMFRLRGDYRALVRSTVDMLVKRGALVTLVPHVFGDHLESDSLACSAFYERLSDLYPESLSIVRGSTTPSGIKHVIGGCDFFIGSRMHACIAAVSQCVPTIALAYGSKFAGVMNSLGVDNLVIDLKKKDNDEVISSISRTLEARALTKTSLSAAMPVIKSNVMGLFAGILRSSGDYS